MVVSMDRWKGKVAIVTGAGGGVGAEVVKLLLAADIKVVGIDRRPDSLEELSDKLQANKDKFHYFAIDISQDEEVRKVFKQVTEDIGLVHILVNCAGIIQPTSLIDGDTERWRKVLDVNVLGLCIMTREAIRVMKDNNIDGHIVHIGSVSGYVVNNLPQMNVYPASKHAVRALTETLRLEINRLGLKIKVTCVSPGSIRTGIAKNNDFTLGRVSTEGDIKSKPLIQAVDVADAVLYALSTPPHVQVQEMMVRPVGENN